MKKSLAFLIAILITLKAQAHGITEPQHGGIVKVVGDVSLELVEGDNQVKIYILDDAPWNTSGMSGKLKVELNGSKSEYNLTPIEGSGLKSEGLTLEPGSKVLAIITKSDGYSKIAGKFEIE